MDTVTTISQVVGRFRRSHPKNEIEAMIKCGIGLQHVGSGAFRNVYQIDNLPLVVKFPITVSTTDMFETVEEHSEKEFHILRQFRRGKRRYAALQPHLPTVYYMHDATHVMLMHQYGSIEGNRAALRKVDRLSDLISNITGGHDWDNHEFNFGIDSAGHIVVLDFGCFEKS